MKKNVIRTLVVAALGMGALSLTGCDVKAKEYTPGEAIKVGLICLHDNSSTYDKNFMDALEEAANNLGTKLDGQPIVRTNVNEDQNCYKAAKDLVKQGCNVVFADSFGHEKYMLQAAKKWPQVQFCHATGTQSLMNEDLPNYHNAFASIYQGRYLAGYAAGLKLRSMNAAGEIAASNKDSNGNIKLGYIGAYQYAEVISGYTSWFLGVKAAVDQDSSIPGVSMEVTFTKSWFSTADEKTGAETLIGNGAALISQHADSWGAPGACENNKVDGVDKPIPNVTYNIETKEQCPRSYVAYSRINWAPYYEAVINAMYEGKAISGEVNRNWTGSIESGSVEYNVNWDNIASDAATLASYKSEFEAVENSVKSNGAKVVFNCANFTVEGQHLTSKMADVRDDVENQYVPETEAIKNEGDLYYYDESAERSAPYFDLNIDGITLLNSGF